MITPVAPAAEPEPQERKPRLLLFLAIDQARYEYLVRFRPAFKGGLKYLLDHGVSFTDAHHHHALTATGPGHAALATGLHPSRSGIVGNSWFDRRSGKEMYCVEDSSAPILPSREELQRTGRRSPAASSAGRSPRNLLATSLADWMQTETPESKVFAVSRKDRSAILLAGQQPDGAFWYEDGRFVTSTYYEREYPEWVEAFHESDKYPDSFLGKAWEPLPESEAWYDRVGIQDLAEGLYEEDFPHPIGGLTLAPNPRFYTAFGSTPFMEAYLFRFVKELIEQEGLGEDEAVDFLGLSFSVIDSIGHTYGPNSPEIFDGFLRLDQDLGDFMTFLDTQIGLDNVLISLSADHGVMPLPEYLKMTEQPGGRLSVADILRFQQMGKQFEAQFGEDDWFLSGFYLNYETIGRRNLRRQEVEEALSRLLEQTDIVDQVWTRTELENPPPSPDRFYELYVNSFHPLRSPDLMLQLQEFYLLSRGYGTSHGSPFEYDTHVPILLALPGTAAAEVEQRVYTVDMAPTLARLLGVAAPEKLDGVDLSGLIQ